MAAWLVVAAVVPASANDSVATLAAGGIVLTKSEGIVMERENLFISAHRVRVEYRFRNVSGADILTRVAFPLPEWDEDGDIGWGKHHTAENPMHFSVVVDGTPQPFETEFRGEQAVHHHWLQFFPKDRPLSIVHAYEPVAGGLPAGFPEYLTRDDARTLIRDYCVAPKLLAWIKTNARAHKLVHYTLQSGSNWKGPIRQFRLTIKKDAPEDKVSLCLPDPLRRVSPTAFVVERKDFVPTYDLKLLFVSPRPDRVPAPSSVPPGPAASAPPVSRNEAIEAQVAEGIELAAATRAGVAEYHAARGRVPADRTAAGLSPKPTDTSGNFVTQVDIVNGRIDITYGHRADAALAGQVLSLTPYESGDLSVVWRCGNAPEPPTLKPLGTATGGAQAVYRASTVAYAYQSAACAAVATSPGAFPASILRSQIAEGLVRAAETKAAVTEAYMSTGRPPTNRTEAGLTPNPADSSGNFVTQVDIVNGRIDITYGHRAHAALAGKVLSLMPYESGGGAVVWRCGEGPVFPGTQPLGTSGGTTTAVPRESTVDSHYLPPDCRP